MSKTADRTTENEEKIINVPLTQEQKLWLAARAKENCRAVGREAQHILEAVRRRDGRKAR